MEQAAGGEYRKAIVFLMLCHYGDFSHVTRCQHAEIRTSLQNSSLCPETMSHLPESHKAAGAALVVFFAGAGLVLSVAALHTLLTSARLRRQPTNDFLVSLTVSDLVYCAVCLPVLADILARCGVCQVHLLCR